MADPLEERFPNVAWREPLPATIGRRDFIVCRLCVGTNGLSAQQVLASTEDDLPLGVFELGHNAHALEAAKAAHAAHIAEVHP